MAPAGSAMTTPITEASRAASKSPSGKSVGKSMAVPGHLPSNHLDRLFVQVRIVPVRRRDPEGMAGLRGGAALPPFRPQQSPLEGIADQLTLIVEAKLPHEVCSVGLDSANADR